MAVTRRIIVNGKSLASHSFTGLLQKYLMVTKFKTSVLLQIMY